MTIDTYLQEKLNPQQYAAAADASQHSLILAGAGSGKTRTLTYKIANLVKWHGVDPARILAVTFTNKAAGEMKERLEQITEELWELEGPSTQSQGAGLWPSEVPDFDDLMFGIDTSVPSFMWRSAWWYQRIGTFHSVFLKILKRDIEALWLWWKKNFVIYDPGDTKSLTKQIIKRKWMEDYVDVKECRNTISSRKNSGRSPDQAWLHANSQKEERIFEVYQAYRKSMQESNALDFDDLLLLPKILFLTSPHIHEKRKNAFDHILVDEAQDTNAIQFELMRMMCSDQTVMTFIWDDYQSIYGRRGAVMSNFLNLKQRRPQIIIYKLEINYRSLPHIVEAGNAIISNNKQQYDKDVSAHRSWEHQIRVFSFADDRQEAVQTIELITKLKEENDKWRGDFVILYRTNAQSVPFEQTLIAEGIPYKILGSFKFFDRAEVKDILAYIKFLTNPVDSLWLQRIINTPSRKIGKTSINQIIDYAQANSKTFAQVVMSIQEYRSEFSPALVTKVWSFANLLNGIINTLEMLTPAELIDQIIKWIKYEDRLVAQEWKEKAAERMENLGQLVNMAMKFTQPWRASVEAYLEEVSLMTSADTGEEDSDVIRLMSVHSSKWLEFSHVFVVWCEENIFPLSNAKLDEWLLEEERRGMYVAITRAQNHLFLSHANSRYQRGQLKYNAPSRFLTELPEHLLKRYDFSWWSWAMPNNSISFDEWDRVIHKLFGPGTVQEVRWDMVITRFDNPTFGVRKMEGQWLKRE